MKRITSTIIAALALMTFASIASAHPATRRADARQHRQHVRIHEGVRCGDLTRYEARRLGKGQAHVRRMERRMKSDGSVSLRERARLDRAQDRQSRRIYRLRNNGRTI